MAKISVIVPCYNVEKYLDQTLQSVLAQSFQDWECIMADDGSVDNTAGIAKRWVAKDARFSYYHQPNGGLSSARNLAASHATGEFLLPLDSDDKITPDYMALAMEQFESNPEVKLVYCRARKFGASSGPWKLPPYSYDALLMSNMIFCTAFYRRSDYLRIGGYNPNMVHAYEDWDLWLSLLDRDSVVVRLEQVCFMYRIRKGSLNRLAYKLNRKYDAYRQLVSNHKEKYLGSIPAEEAYAGLIAYGQSSRKEKKYRKLFFLMLRVSVGLLLALLAAVILWAVL